ncbi:MAG TPA: hypothetical protein VMW75_17285 [Thermoanaerobaculia bacterium]|nr:hypothetical protein [Thermoanaerobaculia bacterium]
MRTVLAMLGTVFLLGVAAPPGPFSAARAQAAAQETGTPSGPHFDIRSSTTKDWAEQARKDTCSEMQRLFEETCGTEGKSPSICPVSEGTAAKIDPGSLCRSDTDEYVVALIPDPVHTHLALMFDRLIDAVQQGLQDSGYQFVRAVIPWDSRTHAEPPAFESRHAAEDYASETDKLPGLMAFRKTGAPSDPPSHLFVFVVGESPTGGIVKPQFHGAMGWIKRASSDEPHGLRILGPTFSGSLASLAQLLRAEDRPKGHARIFSGTISGRPAVQSFLEQEANIDATFASFQEASDVAIERFVTFATSRGHASRSIAILSEDESRYGGFPSPEEPRAASLRAVCRDCVRLYFPREISRLRAAYQGLEVKDLDASRSVPREVLPLNLDVSGADDDSVPAFSKQMPLSQEGTLLGIVSELRRHEVKFILLRATDPLDLLFLSHYLAGAYPKGRVVTLNADVLFPREVEDRLLHGTLALSTYAPSPVGNHEFRNYYEHAERICPSTGEAGAYNAVRSLLKIQAVRQHWDRCILLPKDNLDLYQYGWSEEPCKGRQECASAPPVHLLALGADGYWPMAHLGPSQGEQLRSLLPLLKGASQFQAADPFKVVVPISWKVANLAALGLALGFASSLWFASVRSSTQIFAQIAPPVADAPAPIIAAASCFFVGIFTLFLQPFVTSGLSPIEDAGTWIAVSSIGVLVVMAPAITHLSGRARLPEKGSLCNASSSRAASIEKRAQENARRAPIRILLIAVISAPVLALWWFMGASKEQHGLGGAVLRKAGNPPVILEKPERKTASWPVRASLIMVIASPLLGLWWMAQGSNSEPSIQRFTMLRSLQLTSGLSPALPMLLMLGAGVWWAFYVAAGSALLLDGRRPQLPKKANEFLAVPLTESDDAATGERYANQAVTELLDTLQPQLSSLGHYLVLAALAGAVWLLLNGRRPLMTLEEPNLERALSALFIVSGVWIAGSTARLFRIWLKTRQLLVALDARPLREGFKGLEWLSCKTLWRMSLVTSSEFVSLLARVREAFTRAEGTISQAPDLARAMKADLSELRNDWGRISPPTGRNRRSGREVFPADRHPFNRLVRRFKESREAMRTRRRAELAFGEELQRLQRHLALAAGKGLDFLAPFWEKDKEHGEEVPGKKAWEQFVCMVYVSFLLVVLMRIRSLMMAVGGMYILVMVGINSYPFQPRATIAALSAILLLYVLGTATLVFAQAHRDNTLSHLTRTTPGELGTDFWIRTGSFAALPLLTYLMAQFPQINHFFYSWVEPAVQALHK